MHLYDQANELHYFLILDSGKMKTCVLFPHAFSYNYLDGSVARKTTFPASYELYLNPNEIRHTSGSVTSNRKLSLVTRPPGSDWEKRKPTLLHVEDSPQIRLLVSVFLKNHFHIVSAPNGNEALEVAKNDSYDFVLVDVNLGEGIDGFETSRRLRELKPYQQTPIIALTTLDYQHVREECIKSRINAYIQKPFDKAYLLGTMEELDRKVLKNVHNSSHA